MPLTNTSLDWDTMFVDNRNGTCWGQCLVWLSLRRAGKTKAGQDLTDSLETVQRSNISQRSISYQEIRQECETSSRPKYQEDGKFIDGISWFGKYKIIVIHGPGTNPATIPRHAIALYSPWTGAYELFDPNQGVYKSKAWSDIKDAILGFVGYDPGRSEHWFFESVLSVPDRLL